MNDEQQYQLDKLLARSSFDRAARSYDQVAVLQREIAGRLMERLMLIKQQPHRILDVGAGTGYCSFALAKQYPKAQVIALDIAHEMLQFARGRLPIWQRLRPRHRFITADAERLPLADASVDMVFSNLTLQWCQNLEQVFAEFRRVLAPGGVVFFSTFGPDTLKELRASWSQVDDYTHVSAFIDMHDIGDAMVRARLAEPVMDTERLTVTYQDIKGLLTDLKQLGAHNVTRGRPRGLMGKQAFAKFMDAYETLRRDGVLPASYEVVYGHAWAPEHATQQSPGVANVPIDQIGKPKA
jgi:malonyl-CoA O-methyltransferase